MACRGCRSSRSTYWLYSLVMSPGTASLSPLLGLSLLVACGTRHADHVQPIAEAQRARVLRAVKGLREDFNHSLCGSISDVADEQLRKNWIEQWDHIRETWGEWRRFAANYWYRSGPDSIAVEGIAGFTKGECTVQVIWILGSPSPRMAAFFLRSKEDEVDFPPLPSRFMDPPPWLTRPSRRPRPDGFSGRSTEREWARRSTTTRSMVCRGRRSWRSTWCGIRRVPGDGRPAGRLHDPSLPNSCRKGARHPSAQAPYR